MTRNDVLREFVAAMRKMPGCHITDKEAEEILAEAVKTKPMSVVPAEANVEIVKRLRALKA